MNVHPELNKPNIMIFISNHNSNQQHSRNKHNISQAVITPKLHIVAIIIRSCKRHRSTCKHSRTITNAYKYNLTIRFKSMN